MTQAQLSEKSGLSQSTIAQIESGRNQATRYATRLARPLNVTVAWLLDGDEPDGQIRWSPEPQRVDGKEEYLFLDLVEPVINPETNDLEWDLSHPQALRLHWTFFAAHKVKPENCRLLINWGTMEEPYLFHEDWFVVDVARTEIRTGIMAFMHARSDYYVRNVIVNPDGSTRLEYFNSRHPPFDFEPQMAEKVLRPIGTVIYRSTRPTFSETFKNLSKLKIR